MAAKPTHGGQPDTGLATPDVDRLEISARTGELNQVLSNLITNAVDACDHDGRLTITARSVVRDQREGAEIRVSDNGRGIAPANMSRVFEPFFTTKKDVGTGLGLWVVKQIVEGNQGSVSIESSVDPEGRGTAVTVFLPKELSPMLPVA